MTDNHPPPTHSGAPLPSGNSIPAASAAMHPTRRKLLDTAVNLLAEHEMQAITADMILHKAGVSKGSMYHHFIDLADLLESALTQLFTQSVDANATVLTDIVYGSVSKEECFRRLSEVTRHTQSRTFYLQRARRAGVLAMCAQNPRLAARIAAAQNQLTQTYAGLFSALQDRGWMNTDFDPRAAAILIQAYTVGKIVDDISSEPVAPDAWTDLIDKILTRIFG